jgi:hypothetical protein
MFIFEQLDAHTDGIARTDAKAEKAEGRAEDAHVRIDVQDARANVWALIIGALLLLINDVIAGVLIYHFTK